MCDRFRFFRGLEAAMGKFCVYQMAAGTRWRRRREGEGGGRSSVLDMPLSASARHFCSNGGGRDRGAGKTLNSTAQVVFLFRWTQ